MQKRLFARTTFFIFCSNASELISVFMLYAFFFCSRFFSRCCRSRIIVHGFLEATQRGTKVPAKERSLLVPNNRTISTPTTNNLVILRPSIHTFFTLSARKQR